VTELLTIKQIFCGFLGVCPNTDILHVLEGALTDLHRIWGGHSPSQVYTMFKKI